MVCSCADGWHAGGEVAVFDAAVLSPVGFHETARVFGGEDGGDIQEFFQGDAFAVEDNSAVVVPALDFVVGVSAVESLVLEYDPGVVGALGSPFSLFFEEAGYVGEIFASGLFVSFFW